MQGITPFLWFDENAEEAIAFYTSIFENSKILDARNGPDGKFFTGTFVLDGQEFMALNGGPEYRLTPAFSLVVNAPSRAEVDSLWERLSDGGTVLMALDTYPFSERFGWVQDRFGLSWQVTLGERTPNITPCLMFGGQQHGRAEEAMRRYTTVIDHSSLGEIVRYGPGDDERAGTVQRATFTLRGREFVAMDGGVSHDFGFTPAFSLFLSCQTQQEVDGFWDALLDGGQESRCGWLTDRFGVSWQVIPDVLGDLLGDPDPERAGRALQAMLQMGKLDIAGLQRAADAAPAPMGRSS